MASLVQLALVFGGFLAVRSWLAVSSANTARVAAALSMLEQALGDDARLLEVQRWLEREWGGRVRLTRVDGTPLSQSPDAPPEFDTETLARVLAGERVEDGDLVSAALPAQAPRLLVRLEFAPVLLPRQVLGGFSVLGLAALAWVLTRTVAQPVRRMVVMAERLASGDLSARTGLTRRDELGALATALDALGGRLQQARLSEQELLANVSHELRTPLARIRVALELAEAGDAEAARDSLRSISTDLGELQQLLDDVFTVARLSTAGGSASLTLRPVHVPLSALLTRVAQRFVELWPTHHLELRDAAGAPMVCVDPVLLRRAVDNLVDNAAKYSDDGTTVRLSVRRRDALLELVVEDQGCGVPPAELGRVFTPFFRGEHVRARGTGGVGLGLTLARRIVEAHGGTLRLESDGVRGTTVRLTLQAL